MDIRHEKRKPDILKFPHDLIKGVGLLLLLLEVLKQLYLYFIVFDGHYNVWYLPFQLCSMPMYMCLIYAALLKAELKRGGAPGEEAGLALVKTGRGDKVHKEAGTRSKASKARDLGRVLALFMQNFGILGGVAALIVHEGFTWPQHPLLTAHGYVWHILLIALGLYIWRMGLSDMSLRGYLKSLALFLFCAALAELINISLRGYGDCDMFYISPYHLSSQPVFRDIDAIVGRPLGIVIYLFCVMAGAGLIHSLLFWLERKDAKQRPKTEHSS